MLMRQTVKHVLRRRIWQLVGTCRATARHTPILSVGLLCVVEAGATPPQPPVKLVDGLANFEEDALLPDLEVELNSDTVRDVEVESVIRLPNEELVSQPGPVGRSILNVLMPAMSQRDDVVVGRRGDVLVIPNPHPLNLASGVYTEMIKITVIDDAMDFPLESIDFRFFEITSRGMRRISSAEYTDLTVSKVLDFDRNGQPGLAFAGVLGPSRPAGLAIAPRPEQMDRMIESGDPSWRPEVVTRPDEDRSQSKAE